MERAPRALLLIALQLNLGVRLLTAIEVAMSSSFYPVLKDPDNSFDVTFEGKALARAVDLLDQLAHDAGVPVLSSYISFAGDDYGVFDEAGIELPTTVWFAASDGLRTVRALLVGLQPAQFSDAAVSELQSLELILQKADQEQVEWRLAVDI
jgi:hypothetical protein